MSAKVDVLLSQLMVYNRVLPTQEVKSKLQRAQELLRIPEGEIRDHATIADTVNSNMNKIGLRLSRARDDISGEWLYVLNTDARYPGDPTKRTVPADLSQQDALVLKEMLEVFFSTDRCEPVMASDISRSGASESLKLLKDDGWIDTPSQAGRYFPTMRTMLEVGPSLQERYAGTTLFPCKACKNTLFYGIVCANPRCHVRLHKSCYDLFFRQLQTEPGTCPDCGSTLAKPDPNPNPNPNPVKSELSQASSDAESE